MRKYIILFFLVFPFLFSCSSAPEGIIKPDEMAALLTDMHIADGSMLSMSQAPDTMYKYGTGKFLYLFKLHHTDSTQFKKSFRYYTMQPAQFTEIYAQVMKNMQVKADSINKILVKQSTMASKKPVLTTAQPGNPAPGSTPMMQGRPLLPPNVAARVNFEKNKARRDSLINAIKHRKHAVPEK